MAATDRAWLVEVAPAREGGGEGKPSRSAVWRNAWARDGFPKLKAGISTCWDVLCVAAEQFGDRPALGVRRQSSRSTTAAVGSSPYEFISYTQLLANVKQLAAAMSSKCGLGRGSHVAIFGGNSPEWLTVLLACHALGAAAVPVYDTLGEAAVEFILGHGDASAMFCSAAKFPAAAAALARAQHGVATLVVLDAADDVQGQQQIAATSLPPGVQLDSWQDFTAGLSSQAAAVSLEGPASAEDVCVIM